METSDARWSDLAADLDALADAEEAAEADAMVGELTRAEHATIELADRLRAARGAEVVVELPDGEAVRGIVGGVAATWLRLGSPHGTEKHLVPLSAVDGIAGLTAASSPPAAAREPSLTAELRGLQRDRRTVLVRTRGQVWRGRISRVGADHLDLDVMDGIRAGTRVVPIRALLCVTHAPVGLEL